MRFTALGFLFSLEIARAFTLQFENDAVVRYSNASEAHFVKIGEKLELQSPDPLLIESPGRVPIILVGSLSRNSSINVKNPQLEIWADDLIQKKVDHDLSSILVKISEIERLISQKKISQAQAALAHLETQYPSVSYFGFIKSSLYFLLGNRTEAKRALQRALQKHPDHPEGIHLQKLLEGKK